MLKIKKIKTGPAPLLNRKTKRAAAIFISLLLTGILLTVYYLLPVMGAPVDVLNGNGSLDNSTQVNAFTLTNVTGTNSWALDTTTFYAGTGSGRLRSPTGNNISYNGYAYYRFTTTKVPVSTSLNVAYRKAYTNGQPSSGNWTVQAEIWQVGGGAALQTIPINSGNANVSWTNLTNQNVTAITNMNTQYELRLVQNGRTGANSSAYSTTWFDSVQLNVNYDSTPPQVVSASAPTDHNVDVVFNEPLNPASAQTISNYSISPGLNITGAVLQADNKTVRLTTATQVFGTNYTVTVNNVSDISGNAMTTPGTAAFTGVDTTPPTVISATPVSDNTVNIKFSESVDLATAQNVANYSISPSLAVTSAVLQADLQTVQLTTANQTYGTNYTVTAANVKDIAGNVISSGNSAAFTGIDTTPPSVVSATPVTDKTVNVLFSEAVDSATAQNPANYAIAPGLTVASAALQADQKTVLLTTTTAQTKGTSYTVTVTGVKDTHNNAISGSNTATFTGIDTTPPQVVSTTVVNDTTVNLLFNEQVDSTTAQTAASYTVSPALAVNGAVLQADGKTVQLTTAVQTWQTVYTVTVAGVKDTSGNVITGNNTASFTGTDNTPPTVVSAAPVNDVTVDVMFSEKVDGSTAQILTNYVISPSLGVSGAVLQADGKTVRLTTAKQTYQTSYNVTVNGVRDLAGNTLGGNNTAAFLGADTTPPAVVSASDVNYNTVNVVFSEKVDTLTAQTTSNYSISPSLIVKSAVTQSDGVTVKLSTSAQTGGTTYTLTVTGVKDLAGNTVGAANNTAAFIGTSPPVSAAPKVLSASAPDNSNKLRIFSATMDPITTQNAANYSILPALGITGASLEGDGVTVKLTTATQTAGTAYTVTVSNVQDIYGNIIGSSNNTATFTGSGLSTKNPHGSYVNDTNQCAKCHLTHNGQGISLINKPTQTQACYLCHDAGGQSQYDVADQFGKTAPYASSHHKVPEGTQACSDCHNPHDGGKDSQGSSVHWPRLLQSSASPTTNGGNQFCFSCHQSARGTTGAINSATYPAVGVGHNKSTYTVNGVTPFNPVSGTGISCAGCHESHGSSLVKLLRTNPNNDATNVTGDNKSQCYECHSGASADNRYLGQALYDNTTYDPHSLTSSANTNASYPGVTGQAGQCANCHDPHGSANGTSKAAMKTLRGVYNDGKTSYSASDFTFCFNCHNNTSANNKYDIQTPYNDINGGHYIKTAGGNLAVGSKLACEDCHSLHGSANNNKHLMKDSLGSNLGDGRNECLACHQTGKVVEGLTMSAPPSTVPEHSGTTTACLNCHGSAHIPNSGVSSGGVDCSTCHSPIAVAVSSTTTGFHHLMSNTAATYTTTQNGARNCLSCHVDHNKFNNQKAFNLKANYSESFPTSDTTAGQNSDFNAGDTTYGGLCLSCHQNQQTKSYVQPDGTTATPPLSISGFANSAHNYTATSVFGDSTVFKANCVKCHNDDMTKDKQTSTNKFSTHNSSYQRILSPFGDATLTDPLKQQFCFKCHNTTGDQYGTAMSALAKGIQNEFTMASKHDITGASGAQLTCVNCHGPHSASKNPLSAGLSNSDISDPANTLNPFTTASGDISKFCAGCHNSSPPTAVNNGSALVPYSVVFPNGNITSNGGGWNKSAYTGASPAGHYTQGYQCDKCHDNHGSPYSRLTLLPEDPSSAPSATSGICLQCHGNQAGRPAGAANVYTDLTAGSDSTYRHPTLYNTGLHSDTETFPQSTANRHADCHDCHDPHSANNGNPKTVNTTTNTAPAASNDLRNATGVTVSTWPAAWNTVPGGNYTFGTVTNEYELCFKCHSSFNGNFPAPPAGAIAETDIAKEFNPNNASFHFLGIGTSTSKTNAGTYVSPFNTNSKLYCTSCHGAAGTAVTSPGAIHGSSNRYILKAPYTTSTGTSGTGNDLCFKCHDPNTYGGVGSNPNTAASASGFSNSSKGNLHVYRTKHRVACVKCHSAVPHGSQNKKLLVTNSDPAPYNNGSQIVISSWGSTNNWQQSNCNHKAQGSGCN
ncbi:MAG: Ig-like domain-containing protein [Firmicutes bacterium]|nr:Ig-like domain-containing protein [Bacillota bacterium]